MKCARPVLLGFLLAAAPAAAQIQLTYTITAGVVTIDGYFGAAPLETLVIPATLDGLPVTGIADDAFEDLGSATNFFIPASVTNIGDGAFAGCENLSAIIVDSQNPSFSSTNGILLDKDQSTLLQYPGGLDGNAVIPATVTNIAFGAFAFCSGLTGIAIPIGVTTIGDDAFFDCTGLTNLALPASITGLGQSLFSGCANLAAITVDPANPSFSSLGGVLFDKSQVTLIVCPGALAGAYAVPGSVITIESNAFNDCGALTNISIPASVTAIGNGAFFGCSQLKAITVAALNPNYSGAAGVLFDKNKITLIEFPGGLGGSYAPPGAVREIAPSAFESCKNLTSVTIPGTVTNIGVGAFQNCTGLTKVTLGLGILGLQSDAFANCQNLGAITIPGTVKSLGSGAFQNCSVLASATLNTGVASIESNAFRNCYSLDTGTIAHTVTRIGPAAFESCLSLTSFSFPPDLTTIGDAAFIFCSSLTSLTLPAGATNLGSQVFAYCSGLTSVSLPASLGQIPPFTFYECAGLTTLAIPAAVTNIATGAFEQCYDLSAITIPASVTGIADEAFEGCTSLSQVAIPAGVTNLSSTAFNDCSGLAAINVSPQNPAYSSLAGVVFNKDQSVLVEFPGGLSGSYTIPDSVTEIGGNAFENCAALTNVAIPASVTLIDPSAFENCAGLAAISIPPGVTAIGDSAFFGCAGLSTVTIPVGVQSIGAAAFEGSSVNAFYFAGNPPVVSASSFDNANNPAVFYLPGPATWADFAAVTGLSPVPWNPVIETASGFGVVSNQFQFVITGPTNLVLVIEASTNLAEALWTPLQTVTLTTASFTFAEPYQSNLPARFYALAFP